MSEQAAPLDLFEQRSVEPLEPLEPMERGASRFAPHRHFGMQDGECGMCSTHDSNTKPGVYWCHVCDRLGCWEWMGKHKD